MTALATPSEVTDRPPYLTVFNVRLPVIALVAAESPTHAQTKLVAALMAAGFWPYLDDGPIPEAFAADEQEIDAGVLQ